VNQQLLHRVFFNRAELRSGWRLVIFLLIVVASTIAGNFAIRRLLPHAAGATSFLLREVMDLTIVIGASLIMGRIEGRTLSDYGLPWRKMFQKQFWQGVMIGFGGITLLIFLLKVAGVFHLAGLALHGSEIPMWASIYFLVFVLVALREELRNRGYGLFTLSMGIGFWPAAIISASYFALTHYDNSGENALGLFNVLLFGLLACFLLRRTGNLWMPIGLHLAFDWGETYFYGVADSGNTAPGHLLSSSASGPQWLSGGSVGPEGSVLCTVVILVIWAASALWLREIKYDPRSASAGRLKSKEPAEQVTEFGVR